MPKVTMIPATINPLTHLPKVAAQKRRVAGYARVSTDSDEQFTSYEAQVDYYTKFIQSKPEWEFVKVYTDEGISGTNTKRREGFKEMISDALAGNIDLIVTKSVSRFARNTVDSLVTIRKLKENGVECYFEKPSTPLTAKANCLSRSCPALPRRKAVPFPKISPGGSVRASPMGKCIFHTNASSAMKRVRTGVRQWSRRKPESSD